MKNGLIALALPLVSAVVARAVHAAPSPSTLSRGLWRPGVPRSIVIVAHSASVRRENARGKLRIPGFSGFGHTGTIAIGLERHEGANTDACNMAFYFIPVLCVGRDGSGSVDRTPAQWVEYVKANPGAAGADTEEKKE